MATVSPVSRLWAIVALIVALRPRRRDVAKPGFCPHPRLNVEEGKMWDVGHDG